MKNILFITGMFRSGTTLLGRILDGHPEITVASDPYLPFFKILRSELSSETPYSAPLDDYYFDYKKLELFRKIQNTDLNVPFTDLTVLRKMIKEYGEPYSPLLMPNLEKLEGSGFKEIFYSMISLIHESYGNEKDKITGFKEVWADEFIPAMIRSIPEIKVIQILRDPRAVCASKNSSEELYPWLFLIRQWRKFASLSWNYSQPVFKEKVHLLYYENLINNPDEEIKKICEFLNVPFSEKMLDLNTLKDGEGKLWKQNTTYGEGIIGFNRNVTDKWKEILSKDEIKLIEALCYPEMSVHNYKTEYPTLLPSELIISSPRVSDAKIARWIEKYVPNDKISTAFEMSKEQLRYNLLVSGTDDNDIIESCYLFKHLYELITDYQLC